MRSFKKSLSKLILFKSPYFYLSLNLHYKKLANLEINSEITDTFFIKWMTTLLFTYPVITYLFNIMFLSNSRVASISG